MTVTALPVAGPPQGEMTRLEAYGEMASAWMRIDQHWSSTPAHHATTLSEVTAVLRAVGASPEEICAVLQESFGAID